MIKHLKITIIFQDKIFQIYVSAVFHLETPKGQMELNYIMGLMKCKIHFAY